MSEKENELDLFLPTGYEAPQTKESVVDKATGLVQDIKSLPPIDQIKVAADRFKIPINDKPKKNCKKCFERGYTGFNANDKTPTANPDVDKKKEKEKGIPLSFLPRKAQRKYFRDKEKLMRREIRKESTMRELQKIKEQMIKELAISGDKSPEFLPADPNSIVEPIKESEVNDVRDVIEG
jgi:hypothetical protein